MVLQINRRIFLGGAFATMMTGLSHAASKEKKRIVYSVLASDQGPAVFKKKANGIGGVEGVTVYTTPGKPGLEYANFPRELKSITVVMLFRPSSFGESIYKYILAGQGDQKLIEFAQKVNADGRPIILRMFHEFNFYTHPWSVYAYGNDPKDFVPTWRYIVTLLRKHTKLIEFDWNPNRESFIASGTYPEAGATAGIAEFYPGDDVVDWVSFSTYNRGFLPGNDKRIHSFAEDLRPVYRIMDKIAGPSVRFAISETSTTGLGGLDKERWFRDLFDSVEHEFTRIEIIGFFFIDKSNSTEGKTGWALHGLAEEQMFGRMLQDFRMRMGMPVPSLFN